MKTTKTHFKFFKDQCEYWINEIGLQEWKVYYSHQSHEDGLAWVMWDTEGRVATVGLSMDWPNLDPTPENLDNSAFHEVCHILLADLADLPKRTVHTETMSVQMQHAIIRRLEYLLLKTKHETKTLKA